MADPNNNSIYARMLLKKTGYVSPEDLEQINAIPQNAVNMSMGMMGSTSPVTALEGAEAQTASQAAKQAALNSELDTFGNTQVQPKNIVQDSTPLQGMPVENAPAPTPDAAPQDSDYFQKLLKMLNT